jgi:hypothetical protein
MIIGVTHDQDGRVAQRLSVSTKVSIGSPPNGDHNHPPSLITPFFCARRRQGIRLGGSLIRFPAP